MILYFSGTGNSEYTAKRLGEVIEDETLNLFERLRTKNYSAISSEKPWVIVTPTYAWRIPHIIDELLRKTELLGNKNIYFVMTCGGEIANAPAYLKQLCSDKNLNFMGCAEIVMPENYLAMFSTPTQDEALKIIAKSESAIDKAALMIKNGEALPEQKISVMNKLCSGIVNTMFYSVFVHAKKFYATDACISCGKCVNACPLNNISLKNGKPAWGTDCTHCMACINRCPKEAIEYGKISKGKPRYVCPNN